MYLMQTHNVQGWPTDMKKKSLIIFLKKLTDYNHRQWEYESIKWDTQQRIGLTCSISLMTLCLMLISSKTASITMSAFWKFYNKWKIHISLHMVLVEIQLILQQAFKGMERESVVTVWYLYFLAQNHARSNKS